MKEGFNCAGDSVGIDRVIQFVHAMVEPVEAVDFNIFDKTCSYEWNRVKVHPVAPDFCRCSLCG